MAANAIDLTTLAAVKAWIQTTNSGDDQIIQDAITGFSLYVLHQTSRGNADGSVPVASPFNSVVSYDEFYDGNGNNILPLNNWPIVAVSSVNDSGLALSPSNGLTGAGYVIDQSKKFLVLRCGGSAYPQRSGRYGSPYNYRAGWSLGTQNIEVKYTAGFAATPFDLEMMARQVVSRTYKSRQAIGQKTQAMAAGAGTIVWNWDMSDQDKKVIQYYMARVA
jgi:hypothetical protein